MTGDIWATLIATDGAFLVAASPEMSRLDLYDLRCDPLSGQACPSGTGCTEAIPYCTAAGFDAGPPPPDAGVGVDGGDDAGSSEDPDAGDDRGDEHNADVPRQELSCTCRVAGSSPASTWFVGFGIAFVFALRRPRGLSPRA